MKNVGSFLQIFATNYVLYMYLIIYPSAAAHACSSDLLLTTPIILDRLHAYLASRHDSDSERSTQVSDGNVMRHALGTRCAHCT